MAGTQSTPRQSRPRTQLANHAHRPEPEERRVALCTRLPSRGAGLLVTALISNSGRPAKGRPVQNFVRNRRVKRRDGYIRPGRPRARTNRRRTSSTNAPIPNRQIRRIV